MKALDQKCWRHRDILAVTDMTEGEVRRLGACGAFKPRVSGGWARYDAVDLACCWLVAEAARQWKLGPTAAGLFWRKATAKRIKTDILRQWSSGQTEFIFCIGDDPARIWFSFRLAAEAVERHVAEMKMLAEGSM